jgi:hypothetical protein
LITAITLFSFLHNFISHYYYYYYSLLLLLLFH